MVPESRWKALRNPKDNKKRLTQEVEMCRGKRTL